MRSCFLFFLVLGLVGCALPHPPMSHDARPIPFALGVGVYDASPDWRDHHGISRGVVVQEVIADSPAAQAGLHRGDIIVAVDGHPVGWAKEFRDAMLPLAGGEHEIAFYRGEEKKTVRATLNRLR